MGDGTMGAGLQYFLSRNRHHLFQLILDRTACLAQFVFVLQAQPELHGGAKYFGKAQGGVSRDASVYGLFPFQFRIKIGDVAPVDDIEQ